MLRKIAYLLIVAFIVSCGPSVNPALQKKISDIFNKKSSSSFNATGKFIRPMPYTIGQWVLIGTVSDGKKFVSKTSIVGKEGDGWIIETYSINESDESISQICVSGMEKLAKSGNIDDLDILWVQTKDKNGKVSKIEGPVLSMMKGFYKKGLANMNVNVEGTMDGGTVSVPAGTFNGTAKVSSEASFLGSTVKSTGWFHSDVPINGMVKSISDDGKYSSELLDFGTSGAIKSF